MKKLLLLLTLFLVLNFATAEEVKIERDIHIGFTNQENTSFILGYGDYEREFSCGAEAENRTYTWRIYEDIEELDIECESQSEVMRNYTSISRDIISEMKESRAAVDRLAITSTIYHNDTKKYYYQLLDCREAHGRVVTSYDNCKLLRDEYKSLKENLSVSNSNLNNQVVGLRGDKTTLQGQLQNKESEATTYKTNWETSKSGLPLYVIIAAVIGALLYNQFFIKPKEKKREPPKSPIDKEFGSGPELEPSYQPGVQ